MQITTVETLGLEAKRVEFDTGTMREGEKRVRPGGGMTGGSKYKKGPTVRDTNKTGAKRATKVWDEQKREENVGRVKR